MRRVVMPHKARRGAMMLRCDGYSSSWPRVRSFQFATLPIAPYYYRQGPGPKAPNGQRFDLRDAGLLPASEVIHELQEDPAEFRRNITDLVAFLAGNFLLNLVQRVTIGRNIIVFRPPLDPLPVLNEARSTAMRAYLLKILNRHHKVQFPPFAPGA